MLYFLCKHYQHHKSTRHVNIFFVVFSVIKYTIVTLSKEHVPYCIGIGLKFECFGCEQSIEFFRELLWKQIWTIKSPYERLTRYGIFFPITFTFDGKSVHMKDILRTKNILLRFLRRKWFCTFFADVKCWI